MDCLPTLRHVSPIYILMKILGFYHFVPVQTCMDAVAIVYYFFLRFLLGFCIFRVWYWSSWTNTIGFRLKYLFAAMNLIFYCGTPVLNFAYFSSRTWFDFELWNLEMGRKICKTEKSVAQPLTYGLRPRFFIYFNVVLPIFYSIMIVYLHTYFITDYPLYEYANLVMMELWCIVPVLYYLHMVFTLKRWNTVIFELIIRYKIKKVFPLRTPFYVIGHKPVYINEFLHFPGVQLKELRKIHRKILYILYHILPVQHGCFIISLVATYTVSLLQDVVYLNNCPQKWLTFISATRTFHKLSFLIGVFAIGQHVNVTVSILKH